MKFEIELVFRVINIGLICKEFLVERGKHLDKYFKFCTFIFREWTTWQAAGRLNFPRAFGFMTYLPEPMCKERI